MSRGTVLFRVAIGILVLRHAVPFVEEELTGGFFADRFHVPYASWLALGRPAYDALLVAMLVSGVLVSAGILIRVALPLATACVSVHFLLNQLWYSNNRIFLALCLLLLSIAAMPRADEGFWTRMVRSQLSFIYLASALSKLADPDWRSGAVLAGRFEIILPGFDGMLASTAGRWMLGLGAIATELFLALGLWLEKTRKLALWVGVLFHVWIELAFLVLVFSLLTLGTYLLVAEAGTRRRVLRCGPMLARAIGALDWLDKIDTQPGRPTARALWNAGAAMPLTFPFAWPVSGRPEWSGSHYPPRPANARLQWIAPLAGLVAFWIDLKSGNTVAKIAWASAVAVALSAASWRAT